MGSNGYRDSNGRPIVVATGLGMVTSLGCGKEDNWKKLTAGESGIHQIKRFPTDGLKTRIAGTVDFLLDETASAPMLTHALATLAIEEAIAESRVGSKGDFPGPLFAAVPPVEMQWPQWSQLAVDCDPSQPVSGSGLIHAAESGKFRKFYDPSVPTQSAVSHSPRRIASSPSWIALAPEAQAVESETGSPLVPNCSAIRSATQPNRNGS